MQGTWSTHQAWACMKFVWILNILQLAIFLCQELIYLVALDTQYKSSKVQGVRVGHFLRTVVLNRQRIQKR